MLSFLVSEAWAQTATPSTGATASSIATKDVVGWTLTFLSVGASLFWNWKNQQKADRIRASSFKMDEFKRVRDPIETELRELLSLKQKISPYAKSDPSRPKFRAEVKDFNKQANEIYRRLDDALDHANYSGFVGGNDWRVPEQLWDQTLTSFDLALSEARSFDENKRGLEKTAEHIAAIISHVRSRIETEVQAISRA